MIRLLCVCWMSKQGSCSCAVAENTYVFFFFGETRMWWLSEGFGSSFATVLSVSESDATTCMLDKENACMF